MKRTNWDLLFVVGYISLVMGLAIGTVGDVLECSNEPVTWWLVAKLFFMLAMPAVWGYLAGKKAAQTKEKANA